MKKNIGIYGIGAFLPTTVRHNDYWPESAIKKWPEHTGANVDRGSTGHVEEATDGARLVLACMAEHRGDPFRGARERRVMDTNMRTSDMEIAAAKEAVANAQIDPASIDLLLTSTNVPDHLMVMNSPRVHKELNLPRNCFSLQVDAVCNGFLMQLELARTMIAAGRAKNALLVQSAATSRFMNVDDPMSAWFGDAATAVVVGPVADDFGLLGARHETDGRFLDGPVAGVPGANWYEGQVRTFVKDEGRARSLLMVTLNQSKTLIHGALEEAGFAPDDVDFYAAHQGFAWLRKATQKLSRLSNAKTVDTFPFAASVLGCNIPLVLSVGSREGLLKDGDLVASFSGATGAVLSAMVLRWGRG